MPIVVPLVALDVLVLVLWAIATALAIALIMREVGNIFRPIPVVGGYIAGAVEYVAQGITFVVGKLERGVDRLIGAAWHLLARYMDHLWHQIEAQASVFVQMAELFGRLVHAHALLRAVVHLLTRAWHGIEHGVRDLTREAHRIAHRVKALEQEWTKGIGHDLRIHVKALEREVYRLGHRVIPGIRSTADSAEAKAESALHWTRDHAYLPNVKTLEAAGVAILTALGLNWLRCNSNPFNNNRNACGLWSDLESLLGLATLVIGVEDFETLVHTAQELTEDGIRAFEDVFGLGG